MDSCPWTVRIHWATEEQEHSRLHQSRDFMFCLCDKGKKMWCMWCDNWCLRQIKSVPINSNCTDMEILERFNCVWMYDRSSTAEGVDDARLEMFARRCHQAGIIRSHAVNSIPARHGELCRQRRHYLADLLGRLSIIVERCQQLTKCGCKSECHGWCKCFVLAGTTLCSCRCEVESHCKDNYHQGSLCDIGIWLKLLCSLLH